VIRKGPRRDPGQQEAEQPIPHPARCGPLNADLDLPDDPATKAVFEFLDKALKK
jgi:hypothetical protein